MTTPLPSGSLDDLRDDIARIEAILDGLATKRGPRAATRRRTMEEALATYREAYAQRAAAMPAHLVPS